MNETTVPFLNVGVDGGKSVFILMLILLINVYLGTMRLG